LGSKFEKVDKAFKFFKDKRLTNTPFKISEIKDFTDWGHSTVTTYIGKRWRSFLNKNGKFLIVNSHFDTFNQETFRKHHSQCESVKKHFYQLLVEKAVSACISSIEIYNKPDFKYREESFSILIVNAWELLLKARILSLNKDQIESIQITRKDELQYSESGNPKTITLGKAVNILQSSSQINKIVADNLKLLIEMRDGSVHFIHDDNDLSVKIQSIGTAALKNFMTLATNWFSYDFQKFNFYLMPISFYHPSDIDSFSVSKSISNNFKKYLHKIEKQHEEDVDPLFSISLRLETKLVKTSSDEAIHVRVTDNPDAPEITVTEENALKGHYTYKDLCKLLRKRYSDFKLNPHFHAIMRGLIIQDDKFAKNRLLDPNNPTSTHKTFYHARIIEELDKHYAKKTAN
jgi:hypothetical protein